MINVYPYASGSLYTASYAITASYSVSASFINYVFTASKADTVLNPRSGSLGLGVCLLTTEQYYEISGSNTRVEVCDFT